MLEITQKIISFSVVRPNEGLKDSHKNNEKATFNESVINENWDRPEYLIGTTYKINSSPLSQHALYITINDEILDKGTDRERYVPFEIFINSRSMEHFQWIVALTRIISASFRRGGNVTYIPRELKSVFDPRGGYMKKGGKIMPSIVAEIGEVIERHMISIGLIVGDKDLNETQKNYLTKRQKKIYESAHDATNMVPFPHNAALCSVCNTVSLVQMDGCATCLSCGFSKCG